MQHAQSHVYACVRLVFRSSFSSQELAIALMLSPACNSISPDFISGFAAVFIPFGSCNFVSGSFLSPRLPSCPATSLYLLWLVWVAFCPWEEAYIFYCFILFQTINHRSRIVGRDALRRDYGIRLLHNLGAQLAYCFLPRVF